MIHIGCFSGGKDSTRLMLWMIENIGRPGTDWTPVFCDTKWEHPITYAYIQEINETLLNRSLVTLSSETYPDGFVQLCVERKGIPSTKRRFCTGELKVFPLHRYFASLDDEITAYQGIRADESKARSKMPESEWVDEGGGYWIKRPIFRETAQDCFDAMRRYGIKPNPLYLMGASRVGCWPCIMTGLRELKRALDFHPEIRSRVIELETLVNAHVHVKWPATFFKAGTIPDRFCSIQGLNKEGEVCYVPTAQDVFRYLDSVDEDQLPLFEARACFSVYNLCE
jgi:3'-phosphoadenosine 5'-phosphosulfate sulfotransferase (PAPS reductase)/FAD synthetase